MSFKNSVLEHMVLSLKPDRQRASCRRDKVFVVSGHLVLMATRLDFMFLL